MPPDTCRWFKPVPSLDDPLTAATILLTPTLNKSFTVRPLVRHFLPPLFISCLRRSIVIQTSSAVCVFFPSVPIVLSVGRSRPHFQLSNELELFYPLAGRRTMLPSLSTPYPVSIPPQFLLRSGTDSN